MAVATASIPLRDDERRILQAIRDLPGANARTVKAVAGLTPSDPGYFSIIGELTKRGLIHRCGEHGWQVSALGEQALSQAPG